MQVVGGLEDIIADQFKPYRVEINSNRFELLHILWVALLPVLMAVVIARYESTFVTGNVGAIVAVYAVMASVLTAIMPMVNGLIGSADQGRIEALKAASKTSDKNIKEARVLIAKVEVARELYAAVAWSVIVLSLSLAPLLALSYVAFQSDLKNPPVELLPAIRIVRTVLVGSIGFAGSTALIALVQIVSGVHLITRHNQVDVEADLKDLNDMYHL